MIKVSVKGCGVDARPVGPGSIQAMDHEDHEAVYLLDLQRDEAQARSNTEKRKNGETLAAGQRVQADDYAGVDLEYDHVGIHLSFKQSDEIMWYSEEPINFAVDIQRDPELILLAEETPPERPVKSAKNAGIDNPFETIFPLLSSQGEPVFSGVFGANKGAPEPREGVMTQRYYKYSVRVEGIAKPYDPHIAGHIGL